MPLVEEIQPFIATLNSLGHEPEVVARSGESLEPFVIPGGGLPEELAGLLRSSAPAAHREEAETPAGDEPETPPEDSLDFSFAGDEPEAGTTEEDPLVQQDISGLFGGSEDFSLPDMPPDEEETGEPASGGFSVEGLDDFTFPDSLPGEEADTQAPASGGLDLDDFTFPDIDAPQPEADMPGEQSAAETPSDEAAGAALPEESERDGFEVPEAVDDFTISDMEDEPAAKSADAEDILADFSFPDMQTPDLGEEEAEESPEASEETKKTDGDAPEADMDFLTDFMTDRPESRGGDDSGEDDFAMPELPQEDSGTETSGEDAIEELEDVPEEEESPEETDDFSFDNGIELPGAEEDEFPAEGGEQETAAESPASSDDFSLGDFGADFGIQEGKPAADETAINIPQDASKVIDAGSAFSLSEEDFRRMQETLQGLPLNVKIVVEELIGDKKADETAQKNLIRMLVKGAPIKNIAATAGKLAGRTLTIPKGYAKSSGTAWEAEKGSFAYFLRETFLPVFKIAATAVLAAGLLFFLGYKFIYKPILAHTLLSRGYEMIEDDRFREGNELFTEGYAEWPFKEWYFRYAETFIRKKQYQLAREKYERLISEYDDYLDAKGVRTERKKDEYFVRACVEYARFESVLLENFEGAERILRRLLEADMYNYAGLLEAGDNYIRWAEYDEKRFYDKYEEARKSYATALGAYGDNDEILFRFLDVFIHTDNRPEVLRIKNYFEANPKKAVDPVRYAELGGYLLDKNEGVAEVRQILFRALQADKTVADIHYHLARFYNKREEPDDERLALNNAAHLYGAMQPVSRRGLWRLVDTYGRSGQLYVKQKSFLEAEGEFKQGIERYEDGVKKTLLKKDANLGRLYSELGDIYYYQSGDLEAAYLQFSKAEDSLVADPVLYYKKGFIRYAQEDYFEALREFARTEEAFPSSRNLLFALGNANYMRNNFSVAEGYYSFLTERLEADKRRAGELIPDDRASDRALISNLIKTYNNLGVILYKMGERTGDVRSASRAMVLWTNSSELSENYTRERETMVRRDTKNLAYLNLRQILNPLPNYELQIYQPLPRDMNELFF
ncbi:MAG: hypothetical protein LBQ57_02795 [Spirochaetales bacterium]|jgi:hypothetical protein|nr:hypothetical protein [Spirochaetales bacterium]